MKKWLIILSIIFGIGFITSAVLAGHVYYSDLQTYEAYDKKAINISALQNVYIKSDVPIEIHSTTGEAYAEFSQIFTDLIGVAPKYQLAIEEKGNSTYISLNKIEDIVLYLGVKENKAKMSIYLPQGTINCLDIDSLTYVLSSQERQTINLEGININDLKVDMFNADFKLNGAYERVYISGGQSTLDMKSTNPTKLYTLGMREQNIEGLFEKITIKSSQGRVNINSLQSCRIEVENDYGNIQLAGKYEKINLNGNNTECDVHSEIKCTLSTKGYGNMIYANGAFNTISLKEGNSDVEIQTTIIPENISMDKEINSTTLYLTLPSNIEGITLKYLDQYFVVEEESLGEEHNVEDYFESQEFKLDSDFLPLKQEVTNGQVIYKYGNGQVPITIDKNADISIELIDGGYISSSQVE